MTRGRLLATDLDRTLLPNGDAVESHGARSVLGGLIAERGLTLAYVTGRRLGLVEEALAAYALPRPDHLLADVGSTLYERDGTGWSPSLAWSRLLAKDWGGHESGDLAPLFAGWPELELQEPEAQRPHKLSFFCPVRPDAAALVERMRVTLAEEGLSARVVHSIDEAAAVGLVDVLPACGTKRGALEFLLGRLGLVEEEVLFSGDSGNDLELLISPIPAVLVANADDELRRSVQREAHRAGLEHRIHLARGGVLGMNGNYAAGILEGWLHFHPEDEPLLARLAAANAKETG